ncbi:uncharacterized protein LOC120781825 [Bactrocera tryoni]|uniref:uncharacterized protein LOC120781825 n=1 Tax=Bactrocera tryoni TaxID=59916 RepID=UPI001A97D13D|nr:uncharacterized protein LOC120781825 [Bactrocera tryoni]
MGHMTAVANTPTSLNTDNDIESADFTTEMTLAHDTSVSGGLRVSNGESAVKCHQRTQSVYYMPHHGVLRPDSVSTKLRVVFDGSCVTTLGKSLNDFLHIGAKIQLDITDVLLYVRQHQYIVSTDIEKMFRQINVHPDDWDLQRILWFNNNKEITPYHLTTVTYGTRSAPFLAVRVLQQLLEDEGKNYPLAVPALKYGRYVDDIFGGADNTSELKAIANQLKQICTAGGFPLAKWQSNSEEVLNFISPAGACDEPHQLGDCTSKLLGLYWHAKSDNLRFIMKSHSDNQNKSSKRTILSEVAQIFDPLGFLSPLTIKAKMLLQELWLQKIGWDHHVPSKVLQSWQSLQLELQQIDTLNIPRWINTSKATNCEFHGFCDASQLAMAAAIYVTVHSASGEKLTTLLCAKTKVAPLKRLTIPRLELSAALLLSKLITYVKATLQVDAQSTTLWTDSLVTLTWIRSHASRWKDYVRNRVVNIQ